MKIVAAKQRRKASLAYSLQTAASVCNTHFRTSCLWPGVPGPAGMDPGLALMIASVFKVATRVRRSVAAAAVAAALLGGCAVNDTGASEVWDPIETPNRFIFSINRAVDVMAIRPDRGDLSRLGAGEGAEERAQPPGQSRRAGDGHQRGLPGRSQPGGHDHGALPGELDVGRRRPVRCRRHARHGAHQGRTPARPSACGPARAWSRRMAASISCCRLPGRPMRATRRA